MSYPYGLTVHAARTGSLRYGRTTLRPPPPPRTPDFVTERTRPRTRRNPHGPAPVAPVMVGTAPTVPLPRRPQDPGDGPHARLRDWYENGLGWVTVPGTPVRLAVGLRFDVLDVPAEAGRAALRHLRPDSPVALHGDRVRLLVAPGSAEELPGVLEWLEWGSLARDLVALGEGTTVEAPWPQRAETPWPQRAGEREPGRCGAPGPGPCDASVPGPCEAPGPQGRRPGRVRESPGACAEPPGAVPGVPGFTALSVWNGALRLPGQREHARPLPLSRAGGPGAAVWMRPPQPGCEVGASLPTLSAVGRAGGAPDLVRVVDTMATWCHRLRLRRARAQALAFS
jgi:hypothetical protein